MPDACVGSAVGPSSRPLGPGRAGGFLSLLGWAECSRDVDWLLDLLSAEYFTRAFFGNGTVALSLLFDN